MRSCPRNRVKISKGYAQRYLEDPVGLVHAREQVEHVKPNVVELFPGDSPRDHAHGLHCVARSHRIAVPGEDEALHENLVDVVLERQQLLLARHGKALSQESGVDLEQEHLVPERLAADGWVVTLFFCDVSLAIPASQEEGNVRQKTPRTPAQTFP